MNTTAEFAAANRSPLSDKSLQRILPGFARRLCDRAKKQGIPEEADITFHTIWEPMSQQGVVDLMLEMAKGYTFLVVDTLRKSRQS